MKNRQTWVGILLALTVLGQATARADFALSLHDFRFTDISPGGTLAGAFLTFGDTRVRIQSLTRTAVYPLAPGESQRRLLLELYVENSNPDASDTFSFGFALSVGITHVPPPGTRMVADAFSFSGSIDLRNVSALGMLPPVYTQHPPFLVSKPLGELVYTVRLEANLHSRSVNWPPELWSITVSAIPVPEPPTVVSLGLGGVGVFGAVRADRRLRRLLKG